MNSKRRAELQRKLTLNAVPRPPVGLAERIKADIPQYLEPESTAARFTRTMHFNMRIAASIIVVAGSVIAATMFLQQERSQKVASAPIFAPAPRAMQATDTTASMAVARTEEVRLDIVQEPAQIPDIPAARVAPPAIADAGHLPYADTTARAQRQLTPPAEVADAETGAGRDDASGVLSGVAGGRAAEAQPLVAESAPAPAFAPEPAAVQSEEVAAPAPMVAQDAPFLESRRERSATSKSAAVALSAPAAPPARIGEDKKEVFGISVSSQAFYDVRATLESGRRPAASTVNVEALVNYFAGAPAKAPRNVRLEVEASPAAVPAPGDHAVLRFTVDTPAGTGIAATDARIEVVLNDAVVADVHRVGDGDALARESALPRGTSVTGLYAIELKPGLRESQLVATVRLRYTLNGKRETVTRLVNGRDLKGSWQRASRRHRLASLGALWGESLKTTSGGGVDVARRAEELATQEPTDVRARELARAASASAAGGR